MSALTDTTFLDRHPRARRVVERAAVRGAERVARIDDSATTRRAALSQLPAVLRRRFSPAAAANVQKIFELRVRASAGGPEARFTLTVSDGTLAIARGPAPDAHAWLSISLADMIRLTAGEPDLKWSMFAAKRIEFGGDPFTAIRFPALFGL